MRNVGMKIRRFGYIAAGITVLALSLMLVPANRASAIGDQVFRANSYTEDFERSNADWKFWSQVTGGAKFVNTGNVHGGRQALTGAADNGIVSLIGKLPNVDIKDNTVISFWYYSTVGGSFDVHVTAGVAKGVNALTNRETNVKFTWHGKCVPNKWNRISINAKDMTPNPNWFPKYKGSLVGDYISEMQISVLPGKGRLTIDDVSIQTPVGVPGEQ